MNPEPEDAQEKAKAAKPAAAVAKPSRQERLKAALKANMARRKAQARAKGERGATVRDGEDGTE